MTDSRVSLSFFFVFSSRLAKFEWLSLDPEFLDTPVLYRFLIAKNFESCAFTCRQIADRRCSNTVYRTKIFYFDRTTLYLILLNSETYIIKCTWESSTRVYRSKRNILNYFDCNLCSMLQRHPSFSKGISYTQLKIRVQF